MWLFANHIHSFAHFNDAFNAIKKDMLSSKNPFLVNFLGPPSGPKCLRALSFVLKGAHRALSHCFGNGCSSLTRMVPAYDIGQKGSIIFAAININIS